MPTCLAHPTPLIEGIDYEIDLVNGLIKFLSTGALGPTVAEFAEVGGCGVSVEACRLVRDELPCDSETPLVEGEDYELDLVNGRIMFLSTGAFGGVLENDSVCGARVSACCSNSACVPASAFGCDRACYIRDGFDTVFQEGANNYRAEDEKMIKKVQVEAEPLEQSTPSSLEASIGYASTPNCYTWKELTPLPFACQTARSAAQHVAQGTRPDGYFSFPTWTRGRFLSARFRIRGVGGGGTFSGLHKMVKGWGKADNP